MARISTLVATATLLLAASLAPRAAAKCVFTQDSPASMPRPTLPSEQAPHRNPMAGQGVSFFNACPQ
jgi:hypothetical protein